MTKRERAARKLDPRYEDPNRPQPAFGIRTRKDGPPPGSTPIHGARSCWMDSDGMVWLVATVDATCLLDPPHFAMAQQTDDPDALEEWNRYCDGQPQWDATLTAQLHRHRDETYATVEETRRQGRAETKRRERQVR
jgi:hypothetical protein